MGNFKGMEVFLGTDHESALAKIQKWPERLNDVVKDLKVVDENVAGMTATNGINETVNKYLGGIITAFEQMIPPLTVIADNTKRVVDSQTGIAENAAGILQGAE